MTAATVSDYMGPMAQKKSKTQIKSTRRRHALVAGAALASVATLSCDVDLGTRWQQPSRTFGEIVYTETCERIAYTGELPP